MREGRGENFWGLIWLPPAPPALHLDFVFHRAPDHRTKVRARRIGRQFHASKPGFNLKGSSAMSQSTATPSTKKKNGLTGIYLRLAGFADKWQSPFLLLIRLYIGWQCIISGYAHLHNFDATVKQFEEWKIPMPHLSVAVSASTELVGGALLLVGFAARLVSIPLIFNFLVAIIRTDLAYPASSEKLKHLWDNQDILLQDTAFPFLATAIIILLFGPGWLSVDGVIRLFQRKK